MNTGVSTKLYHVKLMDGHTAPAHQNYYGYLGEQRGGKFTYHRADAIKKAQEIGGKIEPQENLFNGKIISLQRFVGAGTMIKYEMYIEFNGLMGKMCKRFSLAELENYFGLNRKDVNLLLKGTVDES